MTVMEFEKLRDIIANVLNLNPDEITPESEFVSDLGADSLDVLEIVMGIEEEFGISIPDDAASGIVTVNDAVEQIKEAVG